MPAVEISSFEQEIIQQIQPEEVTRLLQELIRQRSDYPPGDCRGAIGVVAQKLGEAGVYSESYVRQVEQPNLVAQYPRQGSGSRLVFHAHIDTVPAGDHRSWRMNPFAGEIQDGIVYGRGAGDDKASVAAQIMAIITLARIGIKLNGTLQVAIVSDEESGGLQGTHWLHRDGKLVPHALVVGEQTNNHIAIAERVACGIDLTVFGKSAHGAMPWAGENAVLKTARALTWLHDELFPQLETRRHPYLPPPTLNIGKIAGGIQWSIVPEQCKVEMDRRLIPGETREMAMAEIRQVLDEYATRVEPLRYELFSSGEVAANIDTPSNDPLVTIACRTLEALSLEQRPLTGYVQTSDGRWFARDGIPIIIFGPSDPSVAHAADEHVSIYQLVEATRFLTLLALRWLGISEQ